MKLEPESEPVPFNLLWPKSTGSGYATLVAKIFCRWSEPFRKGFTVIGARKLN